MNTLSNANKNGLKVAVGLNILFTLITILTVVFELSDYDAFTIVIGAVVAFGICLIPNTIVIIAYFGVTKNQTESMTILGIVGGVLALIITGWIAGIATIICFVSAKADFNAATRKAAFNNNNYAQQGYNQAPGQGYNQAPGQPGQGYNQAPGQPQQDFNQAPVQPEQDFNQAPVQPEQGYNQAPVQPEQGYNQAPVQPEQGFNQAPAQPEQNQTSNPFNS